MDMIKELKSSLVYKTLLNLKNGIIYICLSKINKENDGNTKPVDLKP
jgi:hypothetical protein